MPEQIANLASTTLASSYTAGAGSISVTSASGFPSVGTFTLTIRDQVTKAITLLFRVTSVSGTTFTGAAEGSDANANSGDLVDGTIVSVAALKQISQDLNGFGNIAARPATPVFTGARYVASDSVYDEARWNGSSYDQFCAGMKCVPPAAASFSTSAHGTNGTEDSFADANDALIWGVHAASGNNLMVRVGAYPSTPWRKRLRVRHLDAANSFEHVGICFYDTVSGKALVYGFGMRNAVGIEVIGYEWTDLNTPSNYINNLGEPGTFRGGVFEIWAGDDGTHRNWFLCMDGVNAVQINQETNTNFLTPNRLGIAVLPYGQAFTPSNIVTVLDWSDV